MCLCILAPGEQITVRFFHEQIHILRANAEVTAVEIYDLLLQCDSAPLNQFFILYPQALIDDEDHSVDAALDRLKPVLFPDKPDDMCWLYDDVFPCRTHDECKTDPGRICVRIPPPPLEPNSAANSKCLPCAHPATGHIEIPSVVKNDASDNVLRTLDRMILLYKFDVQVPQGESRWFRIIAKPKHVIGQAPVRRDTDPITGKPGYQHQVMLDVLSPSHVLSTLDTALSRQIDETSKDDIDLRNTFRSFQQNVIHGTLRIPGTRTRIEDHRISVLLDRDQRFLTHYEDGDVHFGAPRRLLFSGAEFEVRVWYSGTAMAWFKDEDRLVREILRYLSRYGRGEQNAKTKEDITQALGITDHAAACAVIDAMISTTVIKDNTQRLCYVDLSFNEAQFWSSAKLLEIRKLLKLRPEGGLTPLAFRILYEISWDYMEPARILRRKITTVIKWLLPIAALTLSIWRLLFPR